MKANVVHSDINPCGGAEQVALATIQALADMGMEVDLTVAKTPDLDRIKKVFGEKRVKEIFGRISQLRPLTKLCLFSERDTSSDQASYDLTINTHGDVLPYFSPLCSTTNTITYCHYPVAVELIMQRDRPYLQRMIDLGLIDSSMANNPRIWDALLEKYFLMLKNSFVVTNSNFSRNATLRVLRSQVVTNPVNPIIIPPSVNVEEYRNIALSQTERSDSILVLSRIHPLKELENAILLSKLLNKRGQGVSMTIAGNLLHEDAYSIKYLQSLRRMIKDFELSNVVRIELDVPLKKLKSLMAKSKVYFHPMRAEPFGISIVEAMSAGLIPVVPDTGGHTDFVPSQYAYNSLDQAAEIIASLALKVSHDERIRISNLAREFSESNFMSRLQATVRDLISDKPLSTGRMDFRTGYSSMAA